MSITFSCPSCNKSYKVKDSLAGEKGNCKECGTSIRIPLGSQLAIPASKLPTVIEGTQVPGEFTIWKSSGSQFENLGVFIFSGVAILVLFVLAFQMPIFWIVIVLLLVNAGWRWLSTKCKSYELTNQRLRLSSGVLSRNIEDIELFRIKDTKTTQPFIFRLFGRGNVLILSSDMMTRGVMLYAIEKPVELRETIRSHVTEQRRTKSVREVDMR